MDSGPFSTPQPQDRRATTSRPPEPTHHRSTQTVATEESVRSVRRAPSHYEPSYPRRGKLWIIIGSVVAALIIAGVIVWFCLSRTQQASTIDKSKYQAVFLVSGQAFFGKLSIVNDNYLRLTDVWYLQSEDGGESTKTQPTESTNSNVKLIKLGNEIHGPEDEMTFSRNQVMFYENLKADGKVAQAIQQAHSQQ